MNWATDEKWYNRYAGFYSDAFMSRFFKDHKAVREQGVLAGVQLDVINWRKPGSGIDSLVYCMVDNELTVTGDQGDAVYQFKSHSDLLELAGSSLEHFLDRLVAGTSEMSPVGHTWHAETALFRCVTVIAQQRGQDRQELSDENFVSHWLSKPVTVELLGNNLTLEEIDEACGSPEDLQALVDEFGDILFPDDDNIDGFIPTMQVQLHHYGLRLAAAQLSNG